MDTQVEFLALAFDQWSPKVQARFFRDMLTLKDWCYKHKRIVTIVCEQAGPEFVLDSMGITRVTDMELAESSWLVYAVEHEPELPEKATNVTVIKVPPTPEDQTRLDPDGHVQNQYIPPEQDRMATHIDIIDRPSPNPYTPTTPMSYAPMLLG